MRIDNQGSMSLNDVYRYTKPPDEVTHKGDSEFGLFHGSDIKWKRDFSICPICGGVGRYFKRRKMSSRMVICDCQRKDERN